MLELSIRSHFSGAHRLRGYNGACANMHGHNWQVEVWVLGSKAGSDGLLVDFRTLKRTVNSVMATLDHSDLSKHAYFRTRNPTSENIAQYVYHEVNRRLRVPGCRVSRVEIRETPDTSAVYWEETEKPAGRRGARSHD
jgi:6-pyruvoyltetrahydropterin/6-carboxytetrahydropterin synthase